MGVDREGGTEGSIPIKHYSKKEKKKKRNSLWGGTFKMLLKCSRFDKGCVLYNHMVSLWCLQCFGVAKEIIIAH